MNEIEEDLSCLNITYQAIYNDFVCQQFSPSFLVFYADVLSDLANEFKENHFTSLSEEKQKEFTELKTKIEDLVDSIKDELKNSTSL